MRLSSHTLQQQMQKKLSMVPPETVAVRSLEPASTLAGFISIWWTYPACVDINKAKNIRF